ncbi:MAG: hypothetical protein AAF235_05345 [Planctomycetota bacterium]
MTARQASRTGSAAIPVWMNRFETPTADALLDAIGEEPRPHARTVRQTILDEYHQSEHVRWRGEPCGWALDYGDADDPVCSLSSDPEGALVAVRLDATQCERLVSGKPSKGVREILEYGRVVGSRLWVEIRLLSESDAEDGLTVLSCVFAGA